MRRARFSQVLGIAAALALTGAVVARADIASDKPAAIVIFPKLLVDLDNGLDTLVRISNTSNQEQNVLCFYVNVTPRCVRGLPGETCFPDPSDCSGICEPQWQETDFQIQLTARQPTMWLVSEGLGDCQFEIGVCSNNPSLECRVDGQCGGGRCILRPCFRLSQFGRKGPGGQVNFGRVPPAPEEPFIGELKCIAVDSTGAPVARNSLKGEVLIGQVRELNSEVDVASYNAIGIPSVRPGNRDNTLVLGGVGAEYEGCPNILILNHFFDGAVDPLSSVSARIGTDLTLIPCTQDFATQNPDLSKTVAQLLVFNEFEQRFSTSRTVNCFKEIRLSNLDTNQNERSIFSAGVAGTLTGQTRIRGVIDGGTTHGNTLLAVAEEFRCEGPNFPLCSFTNSEDLISSAAINVHFQGIRSQSDFLYLPP